MRSIVYWVRSIVYSLSLLFVCLFVYLLYFKFIYFTTYPYLFALLFCFQYLGTVYREIRQSLIDMQNMFVLFEKKPTITDRLGAPNLIVSPTQSAVQFDGVSFGYTPDKMVRL